MAPPTSSTTHANSVFKICVRAITRENCTIEFESSGNVTKFGEVEYGGLEGNPDIAGLGVSINVMSRCSVDDGCECGCCEDDEIEPKIRKRKPNSRPDFVHDKLDEAIVSVADAQLFLVLASGISFSFESQCGISLYHYQVAWNIIVVGLGGLILSSLLAEEGQKKAFISTLLRLGDFSFSLACFVRLRAEEAGDDNPIAGLPSLDQIDSPLVLPAFCILEDSLNPLSNLSAREKEHLRHRDSLPGQTGTLATILIVSLIVIVIRAVNLYSLICKSGHIIVAYNMMLAISNIGKLRTWMDRSVWLQREDGENPEQDVQGIGQMAPLITLVAIPFTVGNIASFLVGRMRCCRYYPLEEDPDNGGDNSSAPRTADQQGYQRQPSMSLS
ncbi:hypothetical protein ACJ41O_015029 [Fusarium nematophilum]